MQIFTTHSLRMLWRREVLLSLILIDIKREMIVQIYLCTVISLYCFCVFIGIIFYYKYVQIYGTIKVIIDME